AGMRHAARIEAGLPWLPWRSKRGKPLTVAEEETVRALVTQPCATVAEVAASMCLHVNSVKYRLECIAEKWDLDGCQHRHLGIILEAIRRGYCQTDAVHVLEDFLAEVNATLPAGP